MRLFLSKRKFAYQRVFSLDNVYTEQVLKDLAKFCRADKSCFHSDPRLHAVMEGRREVWLRIQQHLKLPDAILWEIYTRKDE